MSKLLLDESPILVQPSLAKKVGLTEAIFIQQLHYWLQESKNHRDGFSWVYNTYEDWQKQFPWWSISTIRRAITKLEKANLIIIGNFNKMKIDNTKWYRINYDLLEDMSRPSVQNEQTKCSNWTGGDTNLNRPITIDYNIDYNIEKKEEEAPANDENPFHFFEQNGFGTIGGYIAEKINQWCDDLSPVLVLEAMKIAVEYGVKNWTYVERILRNWADKKYTTVEQVQAALLAFRESRAKQRDIPKYSGKPTRTEILPDWWIDETQDKTFKPPETQKSSEDIDAKKREIENMLKAFDGNKQNDIDVKKQSMEDKLNKFGAGGTNATT